MKKKDITTIIFVNKNQQAKRPIQVPTSIVKNWKWYLVCLFSSFVLLLSIIFYLTFRSSEIRDAKEQLAKELKSRQKELAKVDTLLLKSQYRSLNEKLVKLNSMIKAKGIKLEPIHGIGGEEHIDETPTAETHTLYEEYLNKLLFYVGRMPIGYPYRGKITSSFGYRENPFTGKIVESHKGIDIKAAFGSVVNSTANGVVAYAGFKGGYGNLIVLNHGNGLETYYGHLSKILVKRGQAINPGQTLGKVGSTGRSTGPHLHYEIHRNGKAINPKPFLALE